MGRTEERPPPPHLPPQDSSEKKDVVRFGPLLFLSPRLVLFFKKKQRDPLNETECVVELFTLGPVVCLLSAFLKGFFPRRRK